MLAFYLVERLERLEIRGIAVLEATAVIAGVFKYIVRIAIALLVGRVA